MMPVIFSWGSLVFFSFGFWLALGITLSAFIFWRRLMEMGLEEEKVLDTLFLVMLAGLIAARLSFVLTHFSQFQLRLGWWLNPWFYPGLSFWGGLLGMGLVFAWRVKKEGWDFWRLTDELVLAWLPLLTLLKVGSFFDGGEIGRPTGMIWGIFLPGDLVRRTPVSLFYALGLFLVWLFLLWIEKSWRGWSWYRGEPSGLPTLVFVNSLSVMALGLAFLTEIPVYWLWTQVGFSTVGLIGSTIVIWLRSRPRRRNESKKEDQKTKKGAKGKKGSQKKA